jgi:hypothetical protein
MNPIPAAFWARLLAFLGSGATGSVTFHCHRGVITVLDLRETVRVAQDDRPA